MHIHLMKGLNKFGLSYPGEDYGQKMLMMTDRQRMKPDDKNLCEN